MLTPSQIQHVADLARLRIDPEQLPRYAEQLDAILEYVRKLQDLDTDGVPELAHAADLSNVFRADEARPSDQDTHRRIIAAFPHREGDLLEVPAVFERG